MTVTAPPRQPHPSDPVDRDELEALVEALIEEARQRAQRRRRVYSAIAALAALGGIAVFTVLEHSAQSQTASPGVSARSSLATQVANSKIAFIRGPANRPGWTIWLMNADGSRTQQLVRNSFNSFNPAWAPDGEKIAFQSQREGNFDIFVMNADGTGQRNLTRNPASNDGVPSWSPDGRKITFLRWDAADASGGIYLMNADGSGLRRLASDATGHYGAPDWSPDGRRIAFERARDIYVMNADGSRERNLTPTSEHDFAPAWSPDGRKIAFARSRDDIPVGANIEIYVMNADGRAISRDSHGARGGTGLRSGRPTGAGSSSPATATAAEST
jgi:Tol biopolymer transport system component